MKAINTKLLRDLRGLRGQVLTICLLVASGVAGYVAMQSAYRSLYASRDAYYSAYRFADVFATLKRAPKQLQARLREVPGVSQLETRLVEAIRVPLPSDTRREVTGQIVSLPDAKNATLNSVHIVRGRFPDSEHDDEALLLESFAEAHDVSVGDAIDVVVEGSKRRIRVVGTSMSPEFVFAIGGDVLGYKPGSFAVLWMRESAIAPTLDMTGAFNSLTATLQPGALQPQVLAAFDRILDAYGSLGARGRENQMSHHFVDNELQGLKVQATIIPLIFLGVAAFLVNVVLGRLVQLQRGQIATLRALGYDNRAVALHFLKLVIVIVGLGSAIGLAAGAWMGRGLLTIYEDYFQFPQYLNGLDFSILLVSVSIALLTATAGAMRALRQVLNLQPAEAMRPPVPARYRRGLLDRIAAPFVGPMGKMVMRDLKRRPLRLIVSSGGIALAVAILIVGRFATDAIEHLMDLQFEQAMHEDVTVGFRMPLDRTALGSLRALPGVLHAEGVGALPVRLSQGTQRYESVIQSHPDENRLRRLIDRDGHEVELPLDGLLLSDVLADKLGVKAGDVVRAKRLDGDRKQVHLPVSGVIHDMLGLQAYARPEVVAQRFGVTPLISTAMLAVDPGLIETTEARLYALPAVQSIARPSDARANFREQQGSMMLAMQVILAFFASIISIGIVYNNARVTLSMRQRDLASMRVLGFTRAEISSLLLGELGVQVLLAVPVGMWLGLQASEAVLAVDPENFRMPAVVSHRTYAFAVIVTAGAALVSGLLVRRRLDKLDLIGVLKTRE